jgi:uncharacterized protein YjbJ (UPF0337 family)
MPWFGFVRWPRGCNAALWEKMPMNADILQGQWKQMKGKMKEKWGKLTDSDWDQVAGKRDQLIGKLQQHYGLSRDQAEKDLDEWEKAHSQGTKVAGH